MNKLAAMDATTLYFLDPEGNMVSEHFNSGARALDWLRVMIKHKIGQLWVVPSCHTFNIGSAEEERFLEVPDGWRVKKFGDDHLSSIHAYCTYGNLESRNLRSIIWPQETGFDWQPPMSAPWMLRSLNNLQTALKCRLSSSPGVTGRNYALGQLENQGIKHYLSSVSVDLAELPFKESAKDFAWKRDFGEEGVLRWLELEATPPDTWYLHCIDKNSMYLSALAGLDCGIGDPHSWSKDQPLAAAAKLPGLYRVKIKGAWQTGDHPWRTAFNGVGGPDLLYGTLEQENRQEWVTQPLLKLMLDFNYNVEILEGWQWAQSKRFMNLPCASLWVMRQKLKEQDQLAYDSIKTIITSFIGLLGSESGKDKQYYRPDLWAATIELAKARMAYNIDKMATEKALWPVAVMTDALWYISPEADASTALAPLMGKENDLGGFKLEYSLEIDHEVAAALELSSVGEMNRTLGAIAEKREAAARAYHDYDQVDYEDDDDEEAEGYPYDPYDEIDPAELDDEEDEESGVVGDPDDYERYVHNHPLVGGD